MCVLKGPKCSKYKWQVCLLELKFHCLYFRVKCFCSTHSCSGKIVSADTITRHRRLDRERNLERFKTHHINNDISAPSAPINMTPTKCDQPLFKGCPTTVEDVLVQCFGNFVDRQGMTKAALSEDIFKIKSNLPSPNNFPSSYQQARAFIADQLPDVTTFDSCINDCILFRKYRDGRDYTELFYCPSCKEPRYNIKYSYETGSPVEGSSRKKVKVIHMKDRLVRMFGESNIAKLVHAGDITLNRDPNFVRDIYDGEKWREWFSPGGIFYEHPDGACPGAFSGDGLNGNRNKNLRRSMWPLVFTFLSLSAKFRNTLGVGSVLISIVPGWKDKEPNLQSVIEVLVDELIELVDVTLFDAYAKAPLRVKLSLLYYVCDFPANAKIFCTAGAAAYRACPCCETCGVHIPELNKRVHLCSRDYLENDSPLRQSKDFPAIAPNPQARPSEPMDPDIEKEHRKKYESLPNQNQKKKQLKATGVAGEYAFQDAPGHDRTSQVVPDGMHTIADSVDAVFNVVNGNIKESFKKYEIKSNRVHRKDRGVVEPSSKRQKTDALPVAQWELDPDGIIEADKRATSIRYPPSSSLSRKQYFSTPSHLTKMESKIRVSRLE